MLPKSDGLAIELGCGVEFIINYLKQAKELSKNKKLEINSVMQHFVLTDAPKFTLQNFYILLGFISEVLEHLPNYLKGLQEMIRILKSKGSFSFFHSIFI